MYIIYIQTGLPRYRQTSQLAPFHTNETRCGKREEALLGVRWESPSDEAVSHHINRPLSAQELAGCPLRVSVEGFAVDFPLEI